MDDRQLLQNEDIVPAGSSVETTIQGRIVVLPIDKSFQAIEVLRYLYLISPSLPQMNLYYEENAKKYFAVPA